MRLGTTTSLFARRRDGSRVSYEDQLKACREAGFTAVELDFSTSADPTNTEDTLARDDWEAETERIGEALSRFGLEASQARAPFIDTLFTAGLVPSEEEKARLSEMLSRTVKACGRLGVKELVLRPLNDSINTEYDTEVIAGTNRDFYLPFAESASSRGTGIVFENMYELDMAVWTRTFCTSVDDLILLTESFGDLNAGVCWDFGHAHQLFADQGAALRCAGGLVRATHVYDTSNARTAHLIPFVGNIKWEKLVPVLRDTGYKGDFVLSSEEFMNDMPDALRADAAKIAYDFGAYCMGL